MATNTISIINNVSTYNVNTYNVYSKQNLFGRLPIAYSNDISFILRGEVISTTNNNNVFSSTLTSSFDKSIMIRIKSISLPAMSLETTEIPHLSFNAKMQSKPTLGDEITVSLVEDADSKVFINFKDFIKTYYDWVSQTPNNPNYSIRFYIEQFLTPLATTNNTNYSYLSTAGTSRNNVNNITTVITTANNISGTLGTRIFKIILYNPIIKNLNHQTMDYSSTELINRDITIGFEYFEFFTYKLDSNNQPVTASLF